MKFNKLFIFGIVFLFMISLVSATTTKVLRDTMTSENSPTTNYGALTIMNLGTNNGYKIIDGYLYFELANVNVTSNTTLYINVTVTTITNDSIYTFFFCNDDFTENTLIWNNRLTEVTNCGTTPFYSMPISNGQTGLKSITNLSSLINTDADKKFTIKINMTTKLSESFLTVLPKDASDIYSYIYSENGTYSEPPEENETITPYNFAINPPSSLNTINTTITLNTTQMSLCRWGFNSETYAQMVSNSRTQCINTSTNNLCNFNAISGQNTVYFACINTLNSSETKTDSLTFNSSYTTTGNIASREYWCYSNNPQDKDNFELDMPAGYFGYMLIGVHGNSQSASSLHTGDGATIDTYFNDRNWATVYPDLDTSNGYVNWGNLSAKNCYQDLDNYLKRQYTITKIGVYGQSMGGGTALSLASVFNNKINIIGSFFGQSNYTEMYNVNVWTQTEMQNAFVGTPATATNTYNNYSANHQISRLSNIPVFLVHGDADATMNVGQSRQLYNSLTSAGYDVEYYEVAGGTHDAGLMNTYKEELFDYFNNTNVTEDIYGPLFINYSPENLSFTANAGESISFSSDIDSPLDYSIGWYLDNVLQSINNLWTWVIDFFSAGEHIVELRANDSSGQNSTLQYNISVLNVNLAPEINYISSHPVYSAPNYNMTIYCNYADDSNSSDLLNVEIELKTGLFWEPQIVIYESENLSYSIIPAYTYQTGDVIDVRCRATDVDDIPLTSAWFEVDNAINYQAFETAPEKPSTLLPSFGKYKFIIPVLCSDSKDLESKTQRLSYELSRSINGSNYSIIANSSGFVIYSDNIYADAYNTTYSYACRGYDEILYSDYSYTGTIIKANIPVFELVEITDDKSIIANKPKQFTIYTDLSALSGYKVIYSFVDCNNDGIWDDYKQHDSAKIDETYSCVFPSGKSEFKYGVIVNKNDADSEWLGVCDSLTKDVENCEYSRVYPVIAR